MTALAWDDYARGGDADPQVIFGAENETPQARGRRDLTSWADRAACRAAPDPDLFFPPDDAEELAWQDRALCAQVDGELFFPEKGGSARPAKQVCGNCEVRAECLEYALEHNEGFGIWGGLSERERRHLKRQGAAA